MHKIKITECEEACKNEIDGVLEPLDADILDSEEELQHAFAEVIEEVSLPRFPFKLRNLNLIWKETSRAEHEYMNMHTPPHPN